MIQMEFIQQLKEISIYKYNYNENSNLFSPIFFVNKEKSGIEVAKKLSELGIVNSTGTFGLVPANNRKVFKDYCKELIPYDKIYTPNSENLLNNIIAISLMENKTKSRLDNIIEFIRKEVQ